MSLFGTAGIRGPVEDVSPSLALAVGQAAGDPGETFVVGRDGRETGPALAAAMEAGLESAGADVRRLGQVPTPTLAFASRGRRGVMLTASHNPPTDNGIKLFADGVGVRRRRGAGNRRPRREREEPTRSLGRVGRIRNASPCSIGISMPSRTTSASVSVTGLRTRRRTAGRTARGASDRRRLRQRRGRSRRHRSSSDSARISSRSTRPSTATSGPREQTHAGDALGVYRVSRRWQLRSRTCSRRRRRPPRRPRSPTGR